MPCCGMNQWISRRAAKTAQMIKLSRSASLGTLAEIITTTPAITMQKKSSVGIVHQGMAIMAFRHLKRGMIFVRYDMQPRSLVQISAAQTTRSAGEWERYKA
jgi:hypothetical protein